MQELAAAWLVLSAVCAICIVADIFAGHRQPMAVMDIVWPLTALYFGPFGLWAYFSMGRATDERRIMAKAPAHAGLSRRDMPDHGHKSGAAGIKRPMWQSVFVGASHCGAGCTLGDLIAAWLVFLLGWSVAGDVLYAEYAASFTLAYLLGIAFQYFAIVPMRHLRAAEGLCQAIKADTLSIVAFEIGMFGWMALVRFEIYGRVLHPTEPIYWFMMQIAMVIGFITTLPVNWWLIRTGIKERI